MIEWLVDAAGAWTGSNTLHDPHSGKPESSDATAWITPVLDGRFVRMDYTWGYQGRPQLGSLLLGHRRKPEPGILTGHWIDTWHNGDNVMVFEGAAGAGPGIDIRGSYPAPPDPDWGWRIVILPDGDALRVLMHNVTPAGEEAMAVEARYTREASPPHPQL